MRLAMGRDVYLVACLVAIAAVVWVNASTLETTPPPRLDLTKVNGPVRLIPGGTTAPLGHVHAPPWCAGHRG